MLMASLRGSSRTNCVAVDDLEGLKKALEPWPIEVRESTAKTRVVALFDCADSGWPSLANGENREDIECDVATLIMPFVREGEVLVLMGVRRESRRYLHGSVDAWCAMGMSCVTRTSSSTTSTGRRRGSSGSIAARLAARGALRRRQRAPRAPPGEPCASPSEHPSVRL
jgi:hypothetical protein